MDQLAELSGVLGAALVILAYFMLTTRKWHGDDAIFHWTNLAGAALIMASLTFYWNLGTFIIECFWIAISAYGLWRVFEKRG